MKLNIAGKERDVTAITPHEIPEILADGFNTLIYGPSGTGKSEIVEQYAAKNDMTFIKLNLALDVPETIGGIPTVETKDKKEDKVQYFVKTIYKVLEPIFNNTEKKKVLLFLDEINQAQSEVLNCIYSVTDKHNPKWGGYPLENVQVVACGNRNDGSDGVVYLTELPTPLHNRFHIFELVPSKEDTRKYLKEKFKNIPQVAKYINVLLDDNVPPRDIEDVLECIQFNKNIKNIACKVGEVMTQKLKNIQDKVASADPAKALKLCQEAYERFKEDGEVQWASEMLTTEEEIKDAFSTILTDEEIASIMKGGR